MNRILRLVVALALFCAVPRIAFSAALTANEVNDLNKRFSPSVAAKVQIGTVLQTAQQGAYLDLTQSKDSVIHETTGTLSQANIIAMFTTPVTMLAAPGAGKVLVIDEIEFFHDYATAAYTGGGDVTVEYETSGLDVNVFDVALVTAASDDNWAIKPLTYTSTASTASHASLTANANKALKITNATAVFAAGNASNIIKYRIRYHVVTLLT